MKQEIPSSSSAEAAEIKSERISRKIGPADDEVPDWPDSVLTSERVPFFQTTCAALKEADRSRLEAAGVELKAGPFSAAETRQVLANWEAFRSAHSLQPDSARQHLGCGNNHSQEMRAWNKTNGFLPALCKNLRRTGRQVYLRARELFYQDTDKITYTARTSLWTEEEVANLRRLYAQYGPRWQLMEARLGRKASGCAARAKRMGLTGQAATVKKTEAKEVAKKTKWEKRAEKGRLNFWWGDQLAAILCRDFGMDSKAELCRTLKWSQIDGRALAERMGRTLWNTRRSFAYLKIRQLLRGDGKQIQRRGITLRDAFAFVDALKRYLASADGTHFAETTSLTVVDWDAVASIYARLYPSGLLNTDGLDPELWDYLYVKLRTWYSRRVSERKTRGVAYARLPLRRQARWLRKALKRRILAEGTEEDEEILQISLGEPGEEDQAAE